MDQATAASLREPAERTRFHAGISLSLISDSEFLNGQSAIGGQFAAVAGFVLDRAREKGLGRDLPPEWFAQTLP